MYKPIVIGGMSALSESMTELNKKVCVSIDHYDFDNEEFKNAEYKVFIQIEPPEINPIHLAIEAKDKETSDKMKKDLISKDNEIDSLIKKHLDTLAKEKEVKEETKAEVKEETKAEVKEEPKVEVKEETKEEIKEESNENDSNDDKVTIGFFEC